MKLTDERIIKCNNLTNFMGLRKAKNKQFKNGIEENCLKHNENQKLVKTYDKCN